MGEALLTNRFSSVATTGGRPKKSAGNYQVGEIVTLNVGGEPYDFIVVQQGKPSSDYDDSCNGTWLLMKDIYMRKYFEGDEGTPLDEYGDSTDEGNAYYWAYDNFSSSNAYQFLNNNFFASLDYDVRNSIIYAKIPELVHPNYHGSNISVGSCTQKVFILSARELGQPTSGDQTREGTPLSYFSGTDYITKRQAFYNGILSYYETRTPINEYNYDTYNAWWCGFFQVSGDGRMMNGQQLHSLRPAFIVNSSAKI